jgi:hypothetical protein
MQPGCGPCHGIVPELNRLHDAGEVQVLVIHNGATEAVREWIKQSRPRFSEADHGKARSQEVGLCDLHAC